jgi:hypothetical protein
MTELKDLLREGADRAKYYDVTERAWAHGRRRRRLRAAAGSAAVATVISTVVIGLTLTIGPRLSGPALPVESATPRSCEVTPLPWPVGNFTTSGAIAMDPTGRFIAGVVAELPANQYSLLLWDNGEVRELATTGIGSGVMDINRQGDLVASIGATFSTESHFYRDGNWTKLKGPAPNASGLNDSAVIVGSIGERPFARPALWRTPSAEPELLALPEGVSTGRAEDITDDGYVVGWIGVDQSPSARRPAVWAPTGEVRVLRVADDARGQWSPMMLRTVGDAVDVQLDIDSEHPRYYRFALAGGEGVPLATGDRDVVAFMHDGSRLVRAGPGRLTLVSGSTRTDLPVLPGRTPWTVPTAEPGMSSLAVLGISDDGRVMAGLQAVLKPGPEGFSEDVATVWRCR